MQSERVTAKRVPGAPSMDLLPPSAYHDPKEVVWKHLVAQTYWEILEILREDGVPLDGLEGLRLSFLQSFNSQHDTDRLCRQADAVAAELLARLDQGGGQSAARIAGTIAALRHTVEQALAPLRSLRQVDRTPSYVVDGVVRIAGKPADEFAANPDFIAATLELVGDRSAESAALASAAWWRGFGVDGEIRSLVKRGIQGGWSVEDLLAECLLRKQRSGAYPSLREYEFVPGRGPEANRQAKVQAIEEGYYLLGLLMSCVSLMNEGSAPIDVRGLDDACPVTTTFEQAGITLTPAQLTALRRFMLIRATHGLNPGEFTARIASSVRTTFPQALIAALMVRAGKVHGGALAECMQQMDAYLKASSRTTFAQALLRSGPLYGFGHRIHKPSTESGNATACGDPRVAFQVARAREAFPELNETITAFEEFARIVREMKPTLAPNTDFGAAVWFRCLGLAPRVATGIFCMNRLPGLVAQVINQLDYKANALRPPLAVNLPYSA